MVVRSARTFLLENVFAMARAVSKVWSIWLFLLIKAPEYYSENEDIIQLTRLLTYEEAHQKCLSVGGNYSLPTFSKTIYRLLLQKGIKETWLAYRRHQYSNWTWGDGANVGRYFGSYPWRPELTCGVLHLRDRVLEAENCYDGTVGFLCQLQDQMDCSTNLSIIHRFECIQSGGRKFIYGCDNSVEGWYQARTLCTKHGLMMTKMDEDDLVNTLANHWISTKHKECRRVWISLRREKWAYKTEENFIYPVKNKTFWAIGEPSSLGNCCIANIDQASTFAWRATKCTSLKPTVCIRYKEKEEEYRFTSSANNIATVTTESKKSMHITNGDTVLILTIVISSVLLLLYIMLALFISFLGNVTEIQQEACHDESEPLNRCFSYFNDEKTLCHLDTIPSKILSSTRLCVKHCIKEDGLYKIERSDIALFVLSRHRNGDTKIDLTVHTHFNNIVSFYDKDEHIISPVVRINSFSDSLLIGFPHNLPTVFDEKSITLCQRFYKEIDKIHKVDRVLFKTTSDYIWLNIVSDNEQYYPCEYFCVVKNLIKSGLFLDAYIFSSISKTLSEENGYQIDIDMYVMEASFSVAIDFKRQMFQDRGKEADLILNLQSSTVTCRDATLSIKLESTEEWSVNGGNQGPEVTVVDLGNIHHSPHGLLAAQYSLVPTCKQETRTLNNISFHVVNSHGYSEEIYSRFLRIPICD